MTQKFKVRKNGNIDGICPLGKKHINDCKECENLLSLQTFYGDPKLIICRAGGIEGYNYNQWKKKKIDNG